MNKIVVESIVRSLDVYPADYRERMLTRAAEDLGKEAAAKILAVVPLQVNYFGLDGATLRLELTVATPSEVESLELLARAWDAWDGTLPFTHYMTGVLQDLLNK